MVTVVKPHFRKAKGSTAKTVRVKQAIRKPSKKKK